MLERLQQLNEISPFKWEILTNGNKFTILCEDSDCHDPDTDTYLTDLDADACNAWLQKIIDMPIC